MQNSTELHLIVPGICGPLADTHSLGSSPPVNRWVKTLSQSRCQSSAENENDVITEILNLKIEGDFPSAALTLLANDLYDSEMFYMHADPVHLRADMDHAVLTSSVDLDMKQHESSALCDALNKHFHQDGLTFFALNKDQWFVSSKHKINMKTTPLVEATGRNVNFILPAGEDSTRWNQLLTEVQMLMHAHELNVAREDAGLLNINSLWFHGSGELPALAVNAVDTICSQNDMLKGLATHIQCKFIDVPDTVDAYADYLLGCEHGAKSVLELSQLEHLVNYTDVSLWMAGLDELLEQWVYPVLKIMNKNNIKVTLYPCNGKKYQFSKYDALKFWRHSWRSEEIEKYVSSY